MIPVSLSQEVQKTVVKQYKINQSKTPIILNGIDMSNIRQKQSYNLNNPIIVIHVGRLCEVKNHKGLIDACQISRSQGYNIELWLLGDGELFNDIK